MTAVRHLVHLLHGRWFRRLFAVRVSSQLTDGVFQVAVASYVVFSPERAPGPGAIAGALAVVLLPFSALGPFAGVFLDRWSRRQVLAWSNFVRVGLVGLLAAQVHADVRGPALFALVLVCLSVNRFLLAGLSAALPHVVRDDELITANALTPTAGTLSMVGIVNAQASKGLWFIFVQPVAFVLFFIGGLAETNRAPFDMAEAEQELTGGFHTEYSGMRFALFFLAEYANMIVVSSVATTLFFGGWLRPFPSIKALDFLDMPFVFFGPALAGIFWFAIKVIIILYCFLWFRWTWPRYRYDQLMKIGWQYLLPLAIANLILTAVIVVFFVKG